MFLHHFWQLTVVRASPVLWPLWERSTCTSWMSLIFHLEVWPLLFKAVKLIFVLQCKGFFLGARAQGILVCSQHKAKLLKVNVRISHSFSTPPPRLALIRAKESLFTASKEIKMTYLRQTPIQSSCRKYLIVCSYCWSILFKGTERWTVQSLQQYLPLPLFSLSPVCLRFFLRSSAQS